jgi:hypothetical protein
MNTGKHKIWICIRKRHIFIKLTNKKMDNIFAINRGKGKKNRVLVRKRSKIKRALTKRALKLMGYMSDIGGLVFSEFWVLEDLYRLIKDKADQIIMEYENEREDYDEESMVF